MFSFYESFRNDTVHKLDIFLIKKSIKQSGKKKFTCSQILIKCNN